MSASPPHMSPRTRSARMTRVKLAEAARSHPYISAFRFVPPACGARDSSRDSGHSVGRPTSITPEPIRGFIYYFIPRLRILSDNIFIVSLVIRTFACESFSIATRSVQLMHAQQIESVAEFFSPSAASDCLAPAPPIGLSDRSRASARSGSWTRAGLARVGP